MGGESRSDASGAVGMVVGVADQFRRDQVHIGQVRVTERAEGEGEPPAHRCQGCGVGSAQVQFPSIAAEVLDGFQD